MSETRPEPTGHPGEPSSDASPSPALAVSDASPSPALAALLGAPRRSDRLVHTAVLPARAAVNAEWPDWVDPRLRGALERTGVQRPWLHQVRAAELAHAGVHVVLATGTSSGKSLAYLLPGLTAVLQGQTAPSGRGATVLYLAPTKALAADQLHRLAGLSLPEVRAATYDGDTPIGDRSWVRAHAAYVLTNPDMLHHGVLPGHESWASFLRALRYVVVDECHVYRGVFGSHVAAVLRRLRRVAARYRAEPTFVLASATVADPEHSARRLTGLDVAAVHADASPRGRTVVALWEPPLSEARGEDGAPVRRTATAETAELLADLVVAGVRTLGFVRSRRGAEAVALGARRLLAEVDEGLTERVAAYRAGYLPEERRALEARLRSGRLLGLATTSALELGVDIAGLDAVLLAGYPGTRASFWQQIGRAGRGQGESLGVLVARDDPLDTYLVHHPQALLDRPVEASVLDPENPYVLAPHLAAAAAELPLTEPELAMFGPGTETILDRLCAAGQLRRRPAGWFWTRPERASDLADLRGAGGAAVRVVEVGTGRLLGTVDPSAAHGSVHDGAVYLHQGESFLVERLDLSENVAHVRAAPDIDWTTSAHQVSDLRVLQTLRRRGWGRTELSLGVVEVTSQVVSFTRRRVLTGQSLGQQPLDLPTRILRTTAVWWTADDDQLDAAGLDEAAVPGATHAAEHAAIGLLPLLATCDRWDVGGVSTAMHPDTGRATVFVHDGHPGGAGFAERGFDSALPWLRATREAIGLCGCATGCPSCVQSPKCGNGNDPLDKGGALALLDVLLEGAPPTDEAAPPPRPGQ